MNPRRNDPCPCGSGKKHKKCCHLTEQDADAERAHLKEVFTGDELTIIDMGLSGSDNHHNMYVYTRIIACQGIMFGSGLNPVFEKTHRFIQDHIEQYSKNYSPRDEFQRFL